MEAARIGVIHNVRTAKPLRLPSKAVRRRITLTILNLMWMGTAPLWFHLADLERGYDATGGELLLMALPYLIWMIVETVREIRA